jgi:hypothetical protein
MYGLYQRYYEGLVTAGARLALFFTYPAAASPAAAAATTGKS